MRSKSANRFLWTIMTTMTLHIDNPAIVPSLRKILSALEGVTITKTKHEDVPNDVTLAAMREAESGKDAGEVKLDSIESFVASMS